MYHGQEEFAWYVLMSPRVHGTQGQVQTYQVNPDCTCYICYVILLALQKSAEFAIHCAASLYNGGCCLWLRVFNSNISMMLIKKAIIKKN